MMHVPWGWIKQRPQFLAEELAKFYRINVLAENQSFSKWIQIDNPKREIHLLGYPRIKWELKISSFLNFWFRKTFALINAFRSDIIWISYPSQWLYVKESIQNTKVVVYDCMDDMPSFYKDEKTKTVLIELEKSICTRADLIFTSSEALKKVLQLRHKLDKDITVLNNAISLPILSKPFDLNERFQKYFSDTGNFTMVYIGTISSWFDFDSIIYCLDNIEHTQCLLFGPIDCDLPKHSRLIHCGILEHSEIFRIMEKADLLIMPFLLTPLVLGVNPVKAYEYIYSGKPVALIRYPETEKFEKFVNLYRNKKELMDLIINIKSNGPYVLEEISNCKRFANENTWQNRSEIIKNKIDFCYHLKN